MSRQAGVISVVLIGATGRMGLSLLRLLPQFPQLRLHAAVGAPKSAQLGRDSGELAGAGVNAIPISARLEPALEGAGLAIDFSSAAAAGGQVEACADAAVPLLLGTTGLGPDISPLLERAAQRIPLLVAPNTSLGVNVLLALVHRAASALGKGYDIQVQETHHRFKVDSPSGTALALGAAAMEGGGPSAQVGYAALRGGDVVGEHQVHFLGQGERLTLSHSATDRSIFAAGALRAGLWLAGRPPGRYGMADLFSEK